MSKSSKINLQNLIFNFLCGYQSKVKIYFEFVLVFQHNRDICKTPNSDRAPLRFLEFVSSLIFRNLAKTQQLKEIKYIVFFTYVDI